MSSSINPSTPSVAPNTPTPPASPPSSPTSTLNQGQTLQIQTDYQKAQQAQSALIAEENKTPSQWDAQTQVSLQSSYDSAVNNYFNDLHQDITLRNSLPTSPTNSANVAWDNKQLGSINKTFAQLPFAGASSAVGTEARIDGSKANQVGSVAAPTIQPGEDIKTVVSNMSDKQCQFVGWAMQQVKQGKQITVDDHDVQAWNSIIAWEQKNNGYFNGQAQLPAIARAPTGDDKSGVDNDVAVARAYKACEPNTAASWGEAIAGVVGAALSVIPGVGLLSDIGESAAEATIPAVEGVDAAGETAGTASEAAGETAASASSSLPGSNLASPISEGAVDNAATDVTTAASDGGTDASGTVDQTPISFKLSNYGSKFPAGQVEQYTYNGKTAYAISTTDTQGVPVTILSNEAPEVAADGQWTLPANYRSFAVGALKVGGQVVKTLALLPADLMRGVLEIGARIIFPS